MARASQGLVVSSRAEIRRTRLLPVSGEVLVETGRRVEMHDIVARALFPGALHMTNAAASLGVHPSELKNVVLVKEGETVAAGQSIAEVKSFFGFINNRVSSPIDGIVESISKVTGQILFRAAPAPLELYAYLPGVVRNIISGMGVEIEAEVAMVQGIFGIGGEVFGVLKRVHEKPGMVLEADAFGPEMEGAVVACGGRVSFGALEKILRAGARGVIAASARGEDLVRFVGDALNPASTGGENIGLTLVLTEGFGDLAMAGHTFDLLAELDGASVSANGTTQIRAGVMRPEVISLPLGRSCAASLRDDRIQVGDRIRIVRGEAFGKVGRVSAVPNEPKTIGSGSTALVFEVELEENGSKVTVPRPNVELIQLGSGTSTCDF